MNIETAQIILEGFILFIGLYLVFFKSYFKEKGKNIATKEDIEEITEKIETIRNQIYYNTQCKLSLRNEEVNALVNYYEKYHYWLNISNNEYFSWIDENNKENLKEIEVRHDKAWMNCELAEGRMELFVRNDELTKLIMDIKIKTLELHHLVILSIHKLNYLLIQMKSTLDTIPPEQQIEKYNELTKQKLKFYKEFVNEKVEKNKAIIPLNRKFQVIVYDHLKNLLQEK